MPRYEYKCQKCGRRFEWQGTLAEHEAKKAQCPRCKSKRVQQQLSTFLPSTSRK
jgi:putative FmdB family regulatory protein